MRSLAVMLVGALSASGRSSYRNYGTTGHYGNQYGHGGNQDHSHSDHMYGYDFIEANPSLKTGAGLTN